MGIADEITLRPAQPEEAEFLYRVYASTREEELAPLPWDAAQKEAFLRMQFAAQDHHYRTYFGDGDFLIIQRSGVPIGRLYVHRTESEISVVDIALLPESRGVGIGTALMNNVLKESDAVGKPVRLHVEAYNRAFGLYTRLGFVPIEENGLYVHMERLPQRSAEATRPETPPATP